jgi:dihydroflavonol-4-reductase
MGTVLITGGKGFLGQHLVASLSEMGEDVRIFARASARHGQSIDAPCKVVWGDIRDPKAVERAADGVDAVIHLVSNFRKGGSDKKEAYAINVEGTKNVLNASLRCGVKQLIHCSTIGVHGSVRSIPANEDTEFNPGDIYQKTKLEAERSVWDFSQKNGLPVTVIRPISMYGPGDLRMLKLFRMIKKGRFVMVGSGSVLFQPAYIDDVVCGFLLCYGNERAIGEAFILGSEEYLTLKELVQLIASELNVAPPKRQIPLAPVFCLATLCERLCAPLGIDPPLHRRRVSFFQNNRAFSIDKAKQKLGYTAQVPLKEGIKRTIEWYEQHNLL